LLDDPSSRADQAMRQTAALDLMGREGRDPSEIAAEAVQAVLMAQDSRSG
jgi:lipid-A-disaccharide synthase